MSDIVGAHSSDSIESLRAEVISLRQMLNSALEALSAYSRLLNATIDSSDDLVIEADMESGALVYDTEKAFKLYGFPMACRSLDYFMEILYKSLHADDRSLFISDFNVQPDERYNFPKTSQKFEYRFLAQDKTRYWLRFLIVPYGGTVTEPDKMLIFIRNVTRQRSLEELVGSGIEQDSVTGALNLLSLKDNVTLHFETKKNTGIMLVFTIENFELIRQIMEEHYEAEALSVFFRLLKTKIRQDDFVARTGDGEFGVFITGSRSRQSLSSALDEITRRYGEYLADRNLTTELTVMAGVAIAPEDGGDFDTLYKNAKKALHKMRAPGEDAQ